MERNFFFRRIGICLGPENLSLLFGLKRLYPEYFQNLRQKKIPEKKSWLQVALVPTGLNDKLHNSMSKLCQNDCQKSLLLLK